jgi:hypothetical protein
VRASSVVKLIYGSALAVEALGKHVGDLGLCGLETLSDTAAAHMAKHGGSLGLSGLRKLSDVAASHLSKHTNPIWPAPPEPIDQRIMALLMSATMRGD